MASRSSSEDQPPRKPKQVYESDAEESAEEMQPRRRPRQQKKGGSGPLDNLALDSVQNTAGGLINGATGALGGITGNAMQNQGGGKGKSDTLRLRLDLNLDVEITLKAKIHGDLELALLYVFSLFFATLSQCSAPWSYHTLPPSPSPECRPWVFSL
jgi:hypothetical protein